MCEKPIGDPLCRNRGSKSSPSRFFSPTVIGEKYGFQSRTSDSILGSVRSSVSPSVGPSVGPSVRGPSVARFFKPRNLSQKVISLPSMPLPNVRD